MYIYFVYLPLFESCLMKSSNMEPLDILNVHITQLALLQTDTPNSPTLYSQITGKYASVESKIFPHILLLCSISYSCFNGLTINQHFIKPLQGEKCTSYLSVVDLSIVLPRVFFFAALCGRTNLRLRSRARMPKKLLRSTF